jgi:hypothetical protein
MPFWFNIAQKNQFYINLESPGDWRFIPDQLH